MSKIFFQANSTTTDGNLSFLYGKQEEVFKNRQKFFKQFHLNLDQAVAMRTQNQTNIQVVDQQFLGRGMKELATAVPVDALVTTQPEIILFLLTADCLPITIFDPEKNLLALAHLSLQSSQLGLTQQLVKFLIEQFDSKPNDFMVTFGPSIHKESYLNDPQILKDQSTWEKHSTLLANGQLAIDLISYNLAQLLAIGVLESNVTISQINTFEDQNYFSHRRSLFKNEPEGRFATIAMLKADK